MKTRNAYLEVSMDSIPGSSPGSLEEAFMEKSFECEQLDESSAIFVRSASIDTDDDDDDLTGTVCARITISLSSVDEEAETSSNEDTVREMVESYFAPVKEAFEKEFDGGEFKIEAISIDMK